MQNELRDRLVELLDIIIQPGRKTLGEIADQLIENGVVAIDNNVVSPKNRPLIQTIADMPLNEVIELIKARQEGRIIVPPCKVGNKVYVDGNTWSEYTCIHYENEFIHSKFFVIGEIVSIVKTKKQLLMKIRVESANHSRYYHKRYTVNAIGKTVFFTKEEAEKALKEREENA